MDKYNLLSSKKDIERICQEENISYLGVFGSYARGENREDSDVDILYEYDDSVSRSKSLLDVAKLKIKLEDLLKKKVDIASRKNLKPLLKPYILSDLVTLYEKN
jgi:hypothetical protein